MQNLCFKICLAWFFLLTLNIHPLLSDDQWPSLDFNDKNKTKVNDALSSCKNVEFERLLNNRINDTTLNCIEITIIWYLLADQRFFWFIDFIVSQSKLQYSHCQ